MIIVYELTYMQNNRGDHIELTAGYVRTLDEALRWAAANYGNRYHETEMDAEEFYAQ